MQLNILERQNCIIMYIASPNHHKSTTSTFTIPTLGGMGDQNMLLFQKTKVSLQNRNGVVYVFVYFYLRVTLVALNLFPVMPQ